MRFNQTAFSKITLIGLLALVASTPLIGGDEETIARFAYYSVMAGQLQKCALEKLNGYLAKISAKDRKAILTYLRQPIIVKLNDNQTLSDREAAVLSSIHKLPMQKPEAYKRFQQSPDVVEIVQALRRIEPLVSKDITPYDLYVAANNKEIAENLAAAQKLLDERQELFNTIVAAYSRPKRKRH